MKASEKAGRKLHPMDVLRLIEEGTIAAARIEENTFSIDRDIFDVLFLRFGLAPVDQAVYLQLYRHSFGRGLNCAQLSNSELQRLCNISHSTVRGAIKRLLDKGCLKLVRPGFQHEARIYRVLLPSEALQYDSATKVSYRTLDTEALVSRARRETRQPAYQQPILHFNMLRPSVAAPDEQLPGN